MPDTVSNISIEKIDQQFPVVGIGASAGGLEAFKLFLASIPEKSGMAYVFVMHLSPSHESYLPEILQKFTKVPVAAIADNVHLAPDHVYIIPPDKMLTTVDSVLKLEPIKNRKIKTIDLFFSSLGVTHQSFSVGVVLSGSLDDGTLGLQVIKANGGITFAQEESTAAFDSMPKSAIDSGAVDFILPADQIVAKLIEINLPFHPNYITQPVTVTEQAEDEDVFRQLLTVIRIRKGVDFNNYKQSTIKRRLARRMALNNLEKPAEYLSFLRENKNEQDALYNDLLISVTSFFRDQKSFDLLCSVVFPGIINQKTTNEPLRIWVAGCATGEEAYSIAICIQDYLSDKAAARKIQIFATDVSELAIAKARTGVYRQNELNGLSPEQVQQYFIKLDGSYQVNKSIRDMCVFAHHNLLKDPPFSKIDLVSCRNVLIYLEPFLQKRALAIFHYALNEKGYLMLGKSETIGSSTDLFNPYNPHEKIYQSKGPQGRFRNISTARTEQTLKDIDQQSPGKGGERDIRKKAEGILLEKHTPASVIVNQTYDIVEFCGDTDVWLALPKRKPSFNILKMAREGLSFEIRNLLHLAKTKQVSVRKEGISFKDDDQQHYVNIEVTLLPDEVEDYYLVVFQNSKLAGTAFLNKDNVDGKHPQENVNAWIQRIEQLERELSDAREDMRAITEVQEAANEELQSANEELLSGSEELQSLNEELETSKEELQSTNEEIIIVNTELLDRNDQLSSSRRYAEEIFNTIHDPLMILDSELKVIRATDGYYEMFDVNEQETEGVFIYDLGNKQWDISSLRNQLENILPEQGSFKAFEVDHTFNKIGKKTMRLTARQFDTHAQKKLILLAIHDITDKRKVEEGLAEVERLLAESKERLRFAIESAGIGTWDFNPVSGELIWDNRCRELYGLLPDDFVDYNIFLGRLHTDDQQIVDDAIQKTLSDPGGKEFNLEYRTANEKGEMLYWIKTKGKAYFNDEKIAIRFIGTVLDISAEKDIEQKTKDLLAKKDAFISIASHELKTPITSLKATLQLMIRMKDKPLPMFSRLLEQSGRSMDRISRLVDDLLNVNSMNEGHLNLNRALFNLSEMLNLISTRAAEESNFEITVECDSTLEIYADEHRIEQVVINLVNNAIKYAPAAKQIKIQMVKEPSHVKVSVQDFGPGIPEDKKPFLFERYYRADYSGSNSGLGLGLYISAEIVKRHEGEMGVDSQLGEGSTFWFTLPV